jgi:subtilisin family serine protease
LNEPDRPRVLVLDTGLRTLGNVKALSIEHPDLVDTVRTHDEWRRSSDPLATDDDDEADVNTNNRLDLQSGHGTFIAGIVRQYCPEAVVHLEGVLSSFGDGDDDTIGEGLRRAVDRMSRIDRPPDVVVMSLCGYTDDDRPPPLTRAIAEYVPSGAIVVAAAGNGGSCRLAYPAGLPDVVGVGALDSAGRAWFSNFGGWVDACAPGVDVVSTFFTHFDDEYGDVALDEVNRFRGWAAWSGTSFTAPKVAAAIAHEVSDEGRTAAEAWRRLSNWQKFRYPDLGVVFNIV